ncbi:MAG: ATP-binding cassette domain-containing protein [Lachnospiraceae bacterium]|nr:ATP-binding cassette domain-containing protein [Lachnospiraceae bacterium]
MIKLQNISFTYGEQQVLHNITLNIERGQKIGIIGESGCGKSTLLKLIAGLYAPTSGTISVAGKTDPKEISKCVSVVMQTPMLLPLSIYENITLGHDYPADRIDQVCKMANIKNWIDSLPEGINTYLGNSADELSGGQAQRIAIARAMCKNADILLLDEPTSALDKDTTASVLESIKEFSKDKTVIHVTHQAAHLDGYDHIYKIESGFLS